MSVPLPPQPPRPPMPPPPSPPRPPARECREPVEYAGWAAARVDADFSERGPMAPERLVRWVTSDNLVPAEWVPEEAATDLGNEDADGLEEESSGCGSDESDAGFRVRSGNRDEDSGLPANGKRASLEVPARHPRRTKRPTTFRDGVHRLRSGDHDVRFCVGRGAPERGRAGRSPRPVTPVGGRTAGPPAGRHRPGAASRGRRTLLRSDSGC